MVNAILGKKLGMTQIFRENGDALPATVLKAGPCVVVQRKTAAKDGYEAAQIGLVEHPAPKRLTQALEGHFKRAGANPARFLQEVRLGPGADDVKVGDKVLVDQFTVDERVDVIGVSKGRGFAGFHKRHHFGGGGGAHGSMFHRAPGSIGASSFPPATWAWTALRFATFASFRCCPTRTRWWFKAPCRARTAATWSFAKPRHRTANHKAEGRRRQAERSRKQKLKVKESKVKELKS